MLKVNYRRIAGFVVSFGILAIFPGFLVFADFGVPATTIQNPLSSNSVFRLLVDIMNLVAKVGAIIVVFFIIYSGFKFVTAGSSDTDRTDAKKMFYATIIGGAILLGADVIANVVVNTVEITTGVR